MECEYTLSSISNNGSFLSYPMINKRQILLDWINTINEPQCLLVSGINDLKDGNVFIEIVKHFLYVNNNKTLLYEFFSNDINASSPQRKIQMAIEILIKVSDGEVQNILGKFYNMSERLLRDDEMLIEFLSLVRDIVDKDLILNEDELSNSQYPQGEEYAQNKNEMAQPIQQEEEYSKYINKNQINTLGTLSNPNSGRGQYNFRKDIYQQRRTNQDANPYRVMVNQDFQEPPYYYNNPQGYNEYIPPTLSNEEYIPKVKSIESSKYQESVRERKTEPQIQMQITHSNSINISPSKRQDDPPKPSKRNPSYASNNTTSNISFNTSNNDISYFINDANKLYNKKERALINMTRGIANSHRLYNVDYSMFQLKYFKFFKPSEPIIEVSYNNIKKYHILTKLSQTEPIQKKTEPSKKIQTPKSTFMKKTVSQKISTPIKEMTQAYSNYQEETLGSVNDGVSMTLKTKVYNWLVEIGIIKEKIISIEQLPSICINGVLLCDLINRCEGREEKIKGIIRKTTTRSQIQVNINKVLDYLRSIEKFSSHHLWSGSEIAKGDRKVIWELLDELCSFYGKQNILYSRTRSTNVSFARNRTRSLFMTEQKEKEDNNKRKETETFFDESIHTYKTNKDFNISDISNLNKPPQTATKNKKNSVLLHSTPNPNILNHIENDDSQMFTFNFSKPLRNKNSYIKQSAPQREIPRPMNHSSFKRIRSADKIRCPKSESKTNNSYMNNSHFRYRGILTNQSNGTNTTKSFIIF